ncbi:MAG: glycine betaine ABC transporter ATP-binding protein, partial [Propionibacteriaceae bacterium]|nr:glycine betaine ABC transporter ATP-binding protein [Propionibacteriaceae bacterium]
ITHDLNEAMRLGDRIAMMRDGRVEQIGTAEQILTEPANNYVASFIQDVDRTRVLTASNIMESPAFVIGSNSGPQAAHKVMREGQLSWLLVQNRDRTPAGILWMSDVAEAVRTGRQDLPWSPVHEMPVVSQDTPLADLFAVSALHLNPIIVTDDQGRTVGVIPRVT